jgi:3-oxoadipate enol-lactonase
MTMVPVSGDVELAVDVVGGHGPTLVWGHGLTSCRAAEDARGLFAWRSATEADAWRLVRYDARGHGDSGGAPEPESYEWQSLAHDMLAVAADAGADRFVAGGASMGCASALYAALLAPDRVDALVLVIPPTAWETRAGQRLIYYDNAEFVERRGKQAWLDARQALPRPEIFAGEPELPVEAWVAEALLPSVLRGAAASDLPSADRLASITKPVLILAWATDPAHPVSTAEMLAAKLPSSELHVAATLHEVRRWPALVAEHVSGHGAR